MSKLIIQKNISAGKAGISKEKLSQPKDNGIFKEVLASHNSETHDSKTHSPKTSSNQRQTWVFHLAEGPFLEYQRTVELNCPYTDDLYIGDPADDPNIRDKDDLYIEDKGDIYIGDLYIRETYEFKLAVPVWKILLIPLIKRSFRADSVLASFDSDSSDSPSDSPSSPPKSPKTPKSPKSPTKVPPVSAKTPFWAPSVRIDAKSAHTLSILCLLSVIGGYLGTLLSQTLTFVGDDFSADTRTQGYMLAVIRVGVILAFFLAAAADRYGRRRLVKITVLFGCVFTLLTAASFDIISYSALQTIARALTTGFALLIGIMAAEETPAGARAYAVSVLSLSAALGAGGVVWLLPIADLDDSAWRILYLVPAFALLGLIPLFRALPETSRFAKIAGMDARSGGGSLGRGAGVTNGKVGTGKIGNRGKNGNARIYRMRLVLLGAASFLLSIFLTPASQFQNEFLRDERGFSGARLTLFQLTTNTPGGIGVFLGGKFADLRGRRLVGAIGLAGGTFFIVFRYLIGGWSMWISGGLSAILIAAIIPALGVYSPELFSTSRRGRFGGMLAVIGVSGSVLGLLLVSWLAEVFDNFGSAFALAAIAPLIVILLVLIKFPETANLELEDLNPDDLNPGDTPT